MATAYVSAASPLKRFSSLSRRRSSAAGFGLDALAEFIDTDGVPRRSESITRRMIQRGVSIAKAMADEDMEKGHVSLAQRDQEAESTRLEAAALLETNQRKRERNREMKVRTKREKMQRLEEANAQVAERLVLWYDQRHLSPREEALADVTERNTQQSPSKTLAFIDTEGNLRRRRGDPAVDTLEAAATVIVPIGTPAAPGEPGSSSFSIMEGRDRKESVVRPEMVALSETRV
jgi:hypothetical protein